MKKHFRTLFILIPLLFIAGASYAAYSFTGPTAAPSANNTDGPLIDTSLDQTKTGGLSVNTFTAAKNAYFNQNAIFTGTIFGGTPKTSAPVSFGNTTNKVGVAITGTQSITGIYQSDTLKTGGGEKPICADSNGTFYLCGTTASTGNTSSAPYVSLSYVLIDDGTTTPTVPTQSGGILTIADGNSYYVGAAISYPVSSNVEISIGEKGTNNATVSFLQYIKNSITNSYTANARAAGVCYPPTTTQVLGSVGINAYNRTSWNTIPLGSGCTPADITVFIQNVSPGSVDGQTIQYTSNAIPGLNH